MLEKLSKKQVGRRSEPRKSVRSLPGVRHTAASIRNGADKKSYRIFPQRRSGIKISQVRSDQSGIPNIRNLPQPHSSHSTSHQFQLSNRNSGETVADR